jgi:hypothetical protein
MVFQWENELEKFAVPFLEHMQFQYCWQVPLHNRVIDLAAIDKRGKLYGIEFKLKDWKRALKQAIKNSNAFDYVYVCLPGGKYLNRLIQSAEEQGVGVMVFDEKIGTVKIELPARKITKQWKPNVEYIRNYLHQGGIH